MRSRPDRVFGIAVVLLASAALLAGATPAAAQTGSESGPSAEQADVDLIFEREVFVYPHTSRQDPFGPLVSGAGIGPRFKTLSLMGIIQAADADRSVALLSDGSGDIHRVRSGEQIGNARVLGIERQRVLFAVENYGIVQREVLKLTRENQEGAER